MLLDEPTNHLDTGSREALENTLKDYEGTLLIISHDRYFINKLADRVLYLDQNGVTEYLGNYDYYVEKSKERSSTTNSTTITTEEKPKVNEYKLRKEQQSNLRKLKTRIRKCEEEMESLDNNIEQVQAQLSDQTIASNFDRLVELTNTLEEYQQRQNYIYEEWESLQIEAEEMESQISLN